MRGFTPHHFLDNDTMRKFETNKRNVSHRSGAGFTLIELLLIVGILGVLAALAFPALHDFQLTSDLENSAEELINVLRLAQQKTVASEGASSWGVYFSVGVSPNQYILFKGENYLSREVSADENHKISGAVLISEINLGGESEAVFIRISGNSRQSGYVKLSLKADSSKELEKLLSSY